MARDGEELGRPWRVKEACVERVRVVAAGGGKAETVACHLRARGADHIIDGVALVARDCRTDALEASDEVR
jgi:hypothetical protein